MGTISKVHYIKIDPKEYSIEDAAAFYYHTNLIPISEIFHNDYETYELNQIDIKNKLHSKIKKEISPEISLKLNSSIIAISTMNDSVVMITDIK